VYTNSRSFNLKIIILKKLDVGPLKKIRRRSSNIKRGPTKRKLR
jgi:hypothetical protein